MPIDPGYYQKHLESLHALVLTVGVRHSLGLFGLPLHHKDPFDRLLIAQAREEEMTLVTRDAAMWDYDVQTIW